MKINVSVLLWCGSTFLLLASTGMLAWIVTDERPEDVFELLESGKVVVDVPDRWTGSDQEKWEEEFFRLNPELTRPAK